VILPTSVSDAAKGRALVYLFKWLVTDGQSDGNLAAVRGSFRSRFRTLALTNLKTIQAAGKAVLT